jgi:hypothetical protein
MNSVLVPQPTAALVLSAASDLRTITSATSGSFITAASIGRMEAAAAELASKARELRIHARQLRAESTRAQREAAAA